MSCVIIIGTIHRVSLKVMLETELGITVDKSETLSNWADRPLRPEQVIYGLLGIIWVIRATRAITEDKVGTLSNTSEQVS